MMLRKCEYSTPGYVVIDPWVTGLPMRIRSLLSIHKHFAVGFEGFGDYWRASLAMFAFSLPFARVGWISAGERGGFNWHFHV
jgi:hypothetical protein